MHLPSVMVITNSPVLNEAVREKLAKILPAPAAAILQPDSHPDLLLIAKTKASIGVEETHKIAAWSQLKPFQSPLKLAVIENSDSLTTEAQNSLLKTLEEPGSDTVIVLLARSPHALLATILSRVIVHNLEGGEVGTLEYEKVIPQLIHPDVTARIKTAGQVLKDFPDKKDQLEVVKQLIKRLIEEGISHPEKRIKINSQLDSCLLAYKILTLPGGNQKLTWETLAITME
ncbi:MAG: hypothetical protein JNK26_01430 [Candidatus Doudnabacteria bacterium]|nr:hypothetical protein [Candidatus Doudnabacteria bacterium]